MELQTNMEQYRIHQEKGMEIGLYSIGDHLSNPLTGHRISAQQRINELIETAQLAEEAGLDVFAVGRVISRYLQPRHIP